MGVEEHGINVKFKDQVGGCWMKGAWRKKDGSIIGERNGLS